MSENKIITLRNDALTAEIWTLGARLNALRFDSGPSLCAGSSTVEEAKGQNLFTGSIVGPVANRIRDGRAPLDGRTLELQSGERSHFLHSGPTGTAAQVFSVADQTPTGVTLKLHLEDGLGGLPGNREITVSYLLDGSEIHLTLAATTDAPTLMNLAHHPYWRLNPDAAMTLTVHADRYTPVNDETVPTGEIADVAGTSFDYRAPRPAGTDMDHNFCRQPSAEPTPIARLQGVNVALDVLTTAPGLQIYSGKPPMLAVEPQIWPDAPNHENFPSIHLAPGETFRQDTVYRFSKTA